MKAKAYIIAIPRSLTLRDLLICKPELYTYTDDFELPSGEITGNGCESGYVYLESVLQELKQNVEVDLVGNLKRMAILYYIIDYARENNHLLGEIKIPGKDEKIINVEAEDVKERTKNSILQQGLLDSFIPLLKH